MRGSSVYRKGNASNDHVFIMSGVTIVTATLLTIYIMLAGDPILSEEEELSNVLTKRLSGIKSEWVGPEALGRKVEFSFKDHDLQLRLYRLRVTVFASDQRPAELRRVLTSLAAATYDERPFPVDLHVILDSRSHRAEDAEEQERRRTTAGFLRAFAWYYGRFEVHQRLLPVSPDVLLLESWYPTSDFEINAFFSDASVVSEVWFKWFLTAFRVYAVEDANNRGDAEEGGLAAVDAMLKGAEVYPDDIVPLDTHEKWRTSRHVQSPIPSRFLGISLYTPTRLIDALSPSTTGAVGTGAAMTSDEQDEALLANHTPFLAQHPASCVGMVVFPKAWKRFLSWYAKTGQDPAVLRHSPLSLRSGFFPELANHAVDVESWRHYLAEQMKTQQMYMLYLRPPHNWSLATLASESTTLEPPSVAALAEPYSSPLLPRSWKPADNRLMRHMLSIAELPVLDFALRPVSRLSRLPS